MYRVLVGPDHSKQALRTKILHVRTEVDPADRISLQFPPLQREAIADFDGEAINRGYSYEGP